MKSSCSASGLASPGPIASALWTDTELEAGVCLDAIVTICDASNILRQLTEEREEGAVNEAEEQIAYADIILCNKVHIHFVHLTRLSLHTSKSC